MSVDPNQSLPPRPPLTGWPRSRRPRAIRGWLVGLISAAVFLIVVVAALIVANEFSGGVASRAKSSGGDHAASMARPSASACQRAIIAWFKENLDDPDFEIVKWHEPLPLGTFFRRSAELEWKEEIIQPLAGSSEEGELQALKRRFAAATEQVERSGAVLCFVKYRARNRSGVSQLYADVFVVQASGVTPANYGTIEEHRLLYCPDVQDSTFLYPPNLILRDLHRHLRTSKTLWPPDVLDVLRQIRDLQSGRRGASIALPPGEAWKDMPFANPPMLEDRGGIGMVRPGGRVAPVGAARQPRPESQRFQPAQARQRGQHRVGRSAVDPHHLDVVGPQHG